MAAFEYKALDAKGRTKKGTLEGDNARQVRQRLKEQGMVPIEVMETKAKLAKSKSSGGFKRGISTPETVVDYSSDLDPSAIGYAAGGVSQSGIGSSREASYSRYVGSGAGQSHRRLHLGR